MDLAGIDVNLAAARGIWEGLGRPERLRPSPMPERLVAAGRLGRKTGGGFYRYGDRGTGPRSTRRSQAAARRRWCGPRSASGSCGAIARGGAAGRRRRGRHRAGDRPRHAPRRRPPGRAVRTGCRAYNRPMTRDLHRPLRDAWIIEAVRTPIGRYGGALAGVRPDDLAAAVIRAVVERSGIDPALIEDVILGCANQAGEDNRNVARMALLLAGLPVEVGGLTVNRLCGCGLQAINSAAHAIAVGDGDVFIGGGVESMTRAPYVMAKAEAAVGPRSARAAGHDARLALPQSEAGRAPLPVLDGRDRRERRRALGRSAASAGRLRARLAAEGGRGHRGRPVRRPDRADPGPAAEGRAGRRRPRRASPRRHVGRGAGPACARPSARAAR